MLHVHSLTIFPQCPMTSKACDNLVPSYLPRTPIKNRSNQKQYTGYCGPSIPAISQKHKVFLLKWLNIFSLTKTNTLHSQLKSLPSFPLSSDSQAWEISLVVLILALWSCYVILLSLVLKRPWRENAVSIGKAFYTHFSNTVPEEPIIFVLNSKSLCSTSNQNENTLALTR